MFESLEAQGGDTDDNETQEAFGELLRQTTRRAFVTPILLVLNVIYFVIMALLGVSVWSPTVEQLVGFGANFGAMTLNGEWIRLFLSTFIHIGLVHLAFNMWCLWNLGRIAERIYGNWMFLAIYVASGLGGSIASVWWNPSIVSAGASGAVFGIAGSLVAYYALEARGVPTEFMEESRNSLLAFVGYNLFYGFANTGIDNAAHVGGLMMGLSLGAGLRRPLGASRPHPGMRHAAVIVVIPVVLVAGAELARRAGENVPLVIAVAGDIHFGAGEWDEALERYQRVVELEPGLTYVHQNMGIIYMQKRSGSEARASFEKSLKVDPDNVIVLNLLGESCLVTGDHVEAVAHLEHAAELDPDFPDTQRNLGRARNAGGDAAGAALAYERLRELTPLDARAVNTIAWHYATTDDPAVRNPERALRLAQRAVELSEERDPNILDTLAEAYYVNGNFAEAIKIERRVVAMAPESEVFMEQLAKYEHAAR